MLALITGAAGGIGTAIAEKLAEEGYQVLIHCYKSKDQALWLANGVNAQGIFAADLSDGEQVKAMTDQIIKDFGGVDILVNNSGISEFSQFQDISEDSWDKMIDTNLKSAYMVTKALVPYMISQKNGAIVNVASMWGQVGASCEVHYSASKGGLIAMTKALAKELGPSGIRVNAVAPGVINTRMLSKLSENDLKALVEETPLGRIGEPIDVANAVAFLVSREASFITGQVLGVNGGFVI